jgi:hypothetical protein
MSTQQTAAFLNWNGSQDGVGKVQAKGFEDRECPEQARTVVLLAVA